MGIALVLFGLLSAAVVIDYAIENDLAGAPDRSFELFGGSFTLNQTEIVLGAAVLGGLAVLFLVLGLGLSRGSWGRRRALRTRVSELEQQNAELRSRPPVPVPVVPDRLASSSEAIGPSEGPRSGDSLEGRVDVRADEEREQARRREALAADREADTRT